MKRLQVFVLSLLLTCAAFAISAPRAWAQEIGGDDIVITDPGDDPEPQEEPGWHEDEIGFYYILEDGSRALGLLELDEGSYYLNDDGYRVTDAWQNIDGLYHRFGSDGLMLKDQLFDDGTNTFYLGQNGAAVVNDWAKVSGVWHRFDAAGHMVKSAFYKEGTYACYLDGNGVIKTGWFSLNSDWYYGASNGNLYKSQWLESGRKWYYFGSDYRMVHDTYIGYKGSVYVFDSDGSMRTGWMQNGNDWYYAGTDGKLYRNQTLRYGGKTYYFDSNGKASALGGSWVNTNGNWYFKLDDGTYAKGWNQIGAKWYYFSGSGFLFTNRWIKTNGAFYYVGSDGAMYVSRKAPDGSTVGADGKRITGPNDTKAQGYSSPTSYLILVNYTYHTVSIYKGSYKNWSLTQCYPCSMGKDSSKTPIGTHYIYGKTYSFGDSDHTCYYASGFIGMQYLFHSVLYYPGTFNVKDGRLGLNISNGCIRLYIDDAQWIYNNVPVNTRVEIYY